MDDISKVPLGLWIETRFGFLRFKDLNAIPKYSFIILKFLLNFVCSEALASRTFLISCELNTHYYSLYQRQN